MHENTPFVPSGNSHLVIYVPVQQSTDTAMLAFGFENGLLYKNTQLTDAEFNIGVFYALFQLSLDLGVKSKQFCHNSLITIINFNLGKENKSSRNLQNISVAFSRYLQRYFERAQLQIRTLNIHRSPCLRNGSEPINPINQNTLKER